MNVRVLSMCLFWLRRLAISGSGWRPRALWAAVRPPTVQLAEVGPDSEASPACAGRAPAQQLGRGPIRMKPQATHACSPYSMSCTLH